MNIRIVTSFSARGFEVYGRRFIESYYSVGNDVPLVVYHDSDWPPPVEGPIYRKLYADMPPKYRELPWAHGVVDQRNEKPLTDYRFQAVKFSRKVFAITDLADESYWRIWIDADVEFTKRFDEDFFQNTCYGLCSYLGRTTWNHSECGFVAYNTFHPTMLCFLDEFRELYTSGKVFSLPEWHDSYVFDYLRKKYSQSSLWGAGFHDLAQGIKDNNPWPRTILGAYMNHAKGPKAKFETYGAAV